MIFKFVLKNKLSFIFFILSFLFIYFLFFLNENNTIKNEILSCNKLSYENSLNLKNNNFSAFEISIIINNERRWKKGLIENLINYRKQNSFPNEITEEASIIFKKNNFECLSKAKIKPHGDFSEHHVDLVSGQPYEVPSLKVDLIDSHFFGITKFILFRPISRGYNNEVIATTIINNIGLLAPKTTNIKLIYNEKKIDFIFQERIVKEFLERNRFIEGPIIKGDERYSFNYFKYDQNEIAKISKHKLSNGAWANKTYNNLKVAKKALKILNFINYFYSSEIDEKLLVDYYSASLNEENNKYFSKLPVFDAMMYSLGAVHNLSKDDRRFYYDSNFEIFYPIYYDGDINIINSENKINNQFKNIDQNWYFSMFSENNNPIYKFRKFITKSAKVGSEQALNLVYEINSTELTKQINGRGVQISQSEVNEIIKLIIINLKKLKNIDEDKTFKSKMYFNDNFNFSDSIKKIKTKFVFNTDTKDKYKICELDLTTCNIIEFNLRDQRLLIEQRLSTNDYKSIDYIYMGDLDEYTKKRIYSKNNKKNLKIYSEFNFKFQNIGNNKIEIDSEKKIIEIYKNTKDGKVLLSNGLIEDWEIIFIDNTIGNNIKNNIDISRDENGLTGCLNIFDAQLKNVKLNVFNSKCEDGINIVRSDGSISDIVVLNSISDGVDLDFSEVNISNVNIKKSDGDCIDFSYGLYNLRLANLDYCLDKGVSVGEESVVKINKANINNTEMALASKDYSKLKVNIANVNNSKWCVQAYNKKNEFSGSFTNIILLSCNKKNEKFNEFIKHDNRSRINIQNL